MSYIQINHIFRHCSEMWEFVQHFKCFTFQGKLRVWQGIFDNIRLVLLISERPKVCFIWCYQNLQSNQTLRSYQGFFWPVNYLWNHLSLSIIKAHIDELKHLWPLIGRGWSRDLNTGLLLVIIIEGEFRLPHSLVGVDPVWITKHI